MYGFIIVVVVVVIKVATLVEECGFFILWLEANVAVGILFKIYLEGFIREGCE